jgi:BASS family bile acid:Na+ symporter
MPIVDVALPVIVFLAMVAVGLDLTPAHFARVGQQPALVGAGVLAPAVLLPVLAMLLLEVVDVPSDVATGLLIIAACPIGSLSNTINYLAGASTALSVTLTTLSSLLAFVTIPLISSALEGARGEPLGLVAPPRLVVQLLLMVLVPVLVGMWVRRHWPDVAERRRSTVQKVAFVALAAQMTVLIAGDASRFRSALPATVGLAVVFISSASGLGWMVAAALRAARADRFTLAMEFGARNVAVATAMAVTLMGQTTFAIFAATYFLTEMPLLLVAAAWNRGRVRPATVTQGTVP